MAAFRACVFLLVLGFCGHATAQDGQTELYNTHGRYRLQINDVVEVLYRYTPEFNQVATIQPDGFVALSVAGGVRIVGMTIDEATTAIVKSSSVRLNEPIVALLLREFEKPYFVVGGEVSHPGRFELRGTVNALEAIAIAGGLTAGSKHSQVLLLRKLDADRAEVSELDLKRIQKNPKLALEWKLGPGDMLIVPKNRLSKVERIVKWTSIGMFWNPLL